ncbi:MAG: hypothetical protein NTW98_00460 [Candidatus Nomurabacteria bacterium]|nr:hypothetical protein [Candidatus Nomurabacteria bacterium]
MKFFWFIIALVGTAFYVIPLTALAEKPPLDFLFRETPSTFFFWGMEIQKQLTGFFYFCYLVGLILVILFLLDTFQNLFRKEERWGSNEGLN